MESAVEAKKIISYLTFRLKDEHFAINVGQVVNILEMTDITKVPKAPGYMRGIINLRGEPLPVIDTNTKLDQEETVITGNTCILVIELHSGKDTVRFGTLVDAVHEVLEFEDEMILPPPTISDNYKSDLLKGVVHNNERFIMILDLIKLLSYKDIGKLKELGKTVR